MRKSKTTTTYAHRAAMRAARTGKAVRLGIEIREQKFANMDKLKQYIDSLLCGTR